MFDAVDLIHAEGDRGERTPARIHGLTDAYRSSAAVQ